MMEVIYRWGQPTPRQDPKMGSTMRLFGLFVKSPERITANDLMKMMENGDKLTLLDVRMPEEHFQGHIPKSLLISASNLKYMEGHSFEGKVVLYCTAGVRSYRASKALAARGISVADLVGGVEAWEDAGGRTETGM